MSNSKLVNYTCLSPNCNKPRNSKIDTITIHHMAGNCSVETCGAIFASPSRQASSNYGIGSDGRVGLYVDEANRSWCSSNAANDHRAVTIEVANDVMGGNWHVSDKALAKLIDLCVDICERNGIKKLNFTGDKTGNLTMHKWFSATGCPGEYLESKFQYIADEVNKRLGVATSPSVVASNVIYKSLGTAAKRKKADTSGELSGRCEKGGYYAASQVVTPATGTQQWFRHAGTDLYSALTDTPAGGNAKLFEQYGTYTTGVTNAFVNVRAAAGINSTKLTQLQKGVTVYLTGKTAQANGLTWAEIVYNGRLAWVDKQWVNC